ncbi:RHAG [Symbiodinium natans]|uniref:RHAG protein n=1 Tax=Symbiodinium natans TaxID=878477 RepID=A0A812T8V3_9DINO|nr:RHAG [Symbiodinium natans]
MLLDENSHERAEIIATTGRKRPRHQRLWAQESLSDWWACYADKLEGGAAERTAEESDGLCHVCSTFTGCFLFIALLGLLQERFLSSFGDSDQAQAPLLNAAWGAAAVQVFSSWQHPGAQPRSVLLGNLLGSCAGLIKLLPVSLELQVALAVATTVAAQELSGSVHPAGAANAVIFVEAQTCSWPHFTFMCGSAAVLLIVAAALFNNMCMDRLYPQAWWPSPSSDEKGSKFAPVSFIVHAPQQWLPTYLMKLQGAGLRGPSPVSYAHTCFSSLAAFAYMLSVALLNDLLGWTPASLIGPAAASVSIFSDWRGTSSQPWPCLVGCVIGAASGTFLLEVGSLHGHQKLIPAAMAVACTAALQELTCAKFPAGGCIALSAIVMPEVGKLGWSFFLQPGVLSTCLLVIYGTVLNNLQETRQYPLHWPWQRAEPNRLLQERGHSERDLCRHRLETESRSPSAATKTNVGRLIVLSQIVFLIFLLFAELDVHSLDGKTKFDHVAGMSLLTLVGLGFMRAFVKAYGLGAVGFCMMITCLAIQWSMMLESILKQTVSTISFDSLTSGYLAAATALVSFGALVGKVSLHQILLVLLIELPCYCWSRCVGFSLSTRVLHGRSAGIKGLEIHLFGALFGYAAARILGPVEMDWLNQSSYILDLLSLLGTLCFWICFPSIEFGFQNQHARICIILALLGSTVSAFVTDSFCNLGKLNVASIRTAVLAGGISITAVADVVEPGLAVMVGSASGAVSVLGLRFLSCSGVDTCGVLFAHGVPALLGGLLLVFAPHNGAGHLQLCGCAVSGTCFANLPEIPFSDEANWACAKDVPRGSVYL